MMQECTMDPNDIELFIKKSRSILNRVSMNTLKKAVSEVLSLDMKTETQLNAFVDLLFEKAINEPMYSEVYAFMSNELMKLEVPIDKAGSDKYVNLRSVLLNKCQTEFITIFSEELENDIEGNNDSPNQKEFQVRSEEEEEKARKRSLGLVKFIAELCNLKMLSIKILMYCVYFIIKKEENNRLECLCVLLRTAGKAIGVESKMIYWILNAADDIFVKMQEIVDFKPATISNRVRFMIMDVIDLRKRKWRIKKNIDEECQIQGNRYSRSERGRSNPSVRPGTSYPLSRGGSTSRPCRPAYPPASSRYGTLMMYRTVSRPISAATKDSIKSIIESCIIKPEDDELVSEAKNILQLQNLTDILNLIRADLEEGMSTKAKAKYPPNLVSPDTSTKNKLMMDLEELSLHAPGLHSSIPMIYEYLGTIIGPQIINKHISFSQVPELFKMHLRENGKTLLAATVDNVKGTMGSYYVYMKWQSTKSHSSYSLLDWISKYSFLYKRTYVREGSANTLSPANAQSKLLLLMNNNEEHEFICGWVQDMIGAACNEDWFIRALAQSMCEQALVADSQDKLRFSHSRFNKYLKLLYHYGTIDSEANFLTGIQLLINRLDHPEGLALEIFQYLHDKKMIDVSSFIEWQEADEELDGKEVILESLTSLLAIIKKEYDGSSDEE